MSANIIKHTGVQQPLQPRLFMIVCYSQINLWWSFIKVLTVKTELTFASFMVFNRRECRRVLNVFGRRSLRYKTQERKISFVSEVFFLCKQTVQSPTFPMLHLFIVLFLLSLPENSWNSLSDGRAPAELSLSLQALILNNMIMLKTRTSLFIKTTVVTFTFTFAFEPEGNSHYISVQLDENTLNQRLLDIKLTYEWRLEQRVLQSSAFSSV